MRHCHWMTTMTAVAAATLAGCGDDDAPQLTPAQQELVQATEACLRQAACLGRQPTDVPECVRSFTSEASWYGREGLLGCTAAAGEDCEALLACLNDGEPALSCEPGVDFTASCENGSPPVYHGCEDGVEYAVRCTAGTTCSSTGLPFWPCGIAGCNEAMTPPMCEAGTGRRLVCELGVLIPLGCEDGTVCQDGDCVGAGAPCNATGGMRCDGTVLTYCLGMKQATRDCALTGHTCGAVEGEAACTATQCADRGLTATCGGATLTVCDDGLAYTYACGTKGYACCGAGG